MVLGGLAWAGLRSLPRTSVSLQPTWQWVSGAVAPKSWPLLAPSPPVLGLGQGLREVPDDCPDLTQRLTM